MNKRGLVLEGGGAKGAFQAGAIKAFKELGMDFQGVAGTSIGAVNGAIYAQGDVDKLIELWSTVSPADIMDVDEELFENWVNRIYNLETLTYMLKKAAEILRNGGIRTDKMIAMLRRYIDEPKLRASNVEFGVVTVNLSERRSMEIFTDEMPEGSVLDYVMASAYFPAFQRELLGGKSYVDGGLYDNMPINPLIRRGFDEIVAVRTMSNMPHQKVTDPTVKVSYITPTDPLGRTLSFTKETLKKNLDMGYCDTLRFYRGGWGKYYYVTTERNLLQRQARTITDEGFWRIIRELGVQTSGKIGALRLLCEALIPFYPEAKSEEQRFTLALEGYALAFGVERFRWRKFSELKKEVRAKLNEKGGFPKHPVLKGETERAYGSFLLG